jgi:hypothetical protein
MGRPLRPTSADDVVYHVLNRAGRCSTMTATTPRLNECCGEQWFLFLSDEARHLWQNYAYEGDESGMDGDEVDAHRFSAAMRPHFVEIACTVRRESRPAHVKRGCIRQQRSR